MPSQTKENYLKAIYAITQEKGKVTLSELSKKLSVSKPTVNNMVNKLEAKGWVRYKKYKPIALTPEGELVAALIIRKHRITEMFLVQNMDFGWEEVHEIAEEMEHIDSSALFERMDKMLGYPKVDPHGSPIPNKKGEVENKNYSHLNELNKGDKVILSALTQSSTDFLHFLNSRNIDLGTELFIEKKENFDQSIVVSYKQKKNITLSKTVCDRLLVELV